MKISKSSIFVLAHQLIKSGVASNLSNALKISWAQAKQNQIKTIEFVKKSGEITKRVISTNISKFYTPKGTGKPKPSNLRLFVDMAKVAAGSSFVIISAYVDSIISLS